ncbi:phage late control D family protein [Streptosporangium sp. NPDC050855]|uniref:phage late control D family protein n=1 Tax=Streptosporangium sp. NPDC050855 TaxID=3366194 RepID=UPI0037A12057
MYWRKPLLDFKVSGKKVSPPALEVRVEQKVSEHTLMYISLHYPMDGQFVIKPKMYKENSLVEVRWGWEPDDLHTFFGYIHHADYVSESPMRRQNVQVDYVLVGSGQALSVTRTKDWREMTDSAIAKELARKHQLSIVAHKTKRVHKYVYQDRKTDYAFLQERAAASGRRCWVENGTLYFVDPAAWAAARKATAPEFEIHKSGNKWYHINDFRAWVGDDMPDPTGRKIEHAAYGVDFKTGREIFNTQGDPKARQEVIPDTRLDSQDELDYTLDGAQITSQDYLSATATLKGSTRLQPGQPIKLKGAAVAERLAGEWVITAATHTLRAPVNAPSAGMAKIDFTSHVTLARNAPDTYTYRDQSAPMVDDSAVMAGGKWRSRTMQEVIL